MRARTMALVARLMNNSRPVRLKENPLEWRASSRCMVAANHRMGAWIDRIMPSGTAALSPK